MQTTPIWSAFQVICLSMQRMRSVAAACRVLFDANILMPAALLSLEAQLIELLQMSGLFGLDAPIADGWDQARFRKAKGSVQKISISCKDMASKYDSLQE